MELKMKAEMDQLLELLEACEQLNQAKAKETEMTDQLQDQAQKVQHCLCSHAYSHTHTHAFSYTHRMSCCRESMVQWRLR